MFHHIPLVGMVNGVMPEGVLRSLAIALLYPIWGLGWAGVDLFFVLSGFLITGILLQQRGKPKYFSNFIARRILRIFPIYYLTLFVVFGLLPRFDLSSPLVPDAPWSFWMYVQNWLEVGRVQTGFQSASLGHTWSLAIEEQFYLLFPAVVAFIPRARMHAGFLILILVATLARLGVVLTGVEGFEVYSMVHFSLLTRIDALVMGALLALARSEAREQAPTSPWMPRALWASGLFLAFCIYLSPEPQIDEPAFQVLGYTALAFLSVGLIRYALAGPTGWGVAFSAIASSSTSGRFRMGSTSITSRSTS